MSMLSSNDVSDPIHYRGNGEIKCKDAMASMMFNEPDIPASAVYWWGCAFKYLWRWPWKNGKKDIRKSIQSLIYLLESLDEGDNDEQVDNRRGRSFERVLFNSGSCLLQSVRRMQRARGRR